MLRRVVVGGEGNRCFQQTLEVAPESERDLARWGGALNKPRPALVDTADVA